jgi:hypothetical protein
VAAIIGTDDVDAGPAGRGAAGTRADTRRQDGEDPASQSLEAGDLAPTSPDPQCAELAQVGIGRSAQDPAGAGRASLTAPSGCTWEQAKMLVGRASRV